MNGVVSMDLVHALLLSCVAGTPLLLALLCFLPVPLMKRLLPMATIPALIAPFVVPTNVVVEVPWFFMGGRMGLDPTGCIFLCLSGSIWLFASLAAADRRFRVKAQKRFHSFFLISMSGNFGLILAQGMLGFYLFFALMSFAVYGLVIADNTREARKAATIYLAMVMISEVALFLALVFLFGHTGSLNIEDIDIGALSPLIFLFLYLGFGIKIGTLPVHGWMVPSYRNTPTPAAAALAGSMVNAGILGWLRFLPSGSACGHEIGPWFIAAGSLAAVYGVLIGLGKRHPKEILGCSSISQMGLVTMLFGLYQLPGNGSSAQVVTVLILFAVHHGLAKSSLFLGVGFSESNHDFLKRFQNVFFLVPALALAGLPLTSGAVVKTGFKDILTNSPPVWQTFGLWFLPLSSIGTTLLMLHFIRMVRSSPEIDSGRKAEQGSLFNLISWSASLTAVLLTLWIWPAASSYAAAAMKPAKMMQGLWPVVAGAALLPLLSRSGGPIAEVLKQWRHRVRTSLSAPCRSLTEMFIDLKIKPDLMQFFTLRSPHSERLDHLLRNTEKKIGRWSVTGVSYLLLIFLLLLMLDR